MSPSRIERRLLDVNARLKRAREELAVLDEQLMALADDAEDARVRSLVADSPMADRDYRDADRSAEAMRRGRDAAQAAVAELERTQDELLDKLVTNPR
ncbi:MAG: hypothetical protein QOI20_2527 [Acidimicrobiaceae bacterium]|jgi:chromosome segregation ATPase|nr:hypothetical protein [Acidimicrobiaceae bacterium]